MKEDCTASPLGKLFNEEFKQSTSFIQSFLKRSLRNNPSCILSPTSFQSSWFVLIVEYFSAKKNIKVSHFSASSFFHKHKERRTIHFFPSRIAVEWIYFSTYSSQNHLVPTKEFTSGSENKRRHQNVGRFTGSQWSRAEIPQCWKE